METDFFQAGQLADFNFDSDLRPNSKSETSVASHIPLPDEMPRRADLSHVPRDILKSSTVENLISQNEDLMARLKVALRRLSLLENENHRVAVESHNARQAQSSITDQILVWKEKDIVWRNKVDTLEREKEIHTEKLKALSGKVAKMTSELERHHKYQERIRVQVKPYISQLKEYSKTQELKVQEQEAELARKEAQLRDTRHQMVEVTKNSMFQVETQQNKMTEMIQFYETQIEVLNKDLQTLQGAQAELEIKNLKLHTALERQDTLENEVIILRRAKDEMQERLEKDLDNTRLRTGELTRHNQKLGVEHADLQIRVTQDSEIIETLRKENHQNIEQLESLRYMWNSKSEENEKLKAAMQSLERLNLELSQKINEMRSKEA